VFGAMGSACEADEGYSPLPSSKYGDVPPPLTPRIKVFE